MQKLFERHGFNSTNKALRYVTARLNSRPQTKGLVKSVQALRDKHTAAHNRYESALDARIACSAEIAYQDTMIDRLVMEISTLVLGLAKNDRSAPVYEKVFPSPPSEDLEGQADDTQNRLVANIVKRLSTDPEYKSLEAECKKLQISQTQIESTIKKRDELYATEMETQTDYMIVRSQVQREYNLLYPRLQLTFPDDPNLVESFFAKLSSPKTSSTTSPTEETETE